MRIVFWNVNTSRGLLSAPREPCSALLPATSLCSRELRRYLSGVLEISASVPSPREVSGPPGMAGNSKPRNV